jgi:hypothetical protein
MHAKMNLLDGVVELPQYLVGFVEPDEAVQVVQRVEQRSADGRPTVDFESRRRELPEGHF